MALSKISEFKSPIQKPDLLPEERAQESVLLKERWLLIQKGVERKQIKLRDETLFPFDNDVMLSALQDQQSPINNDTKYNSIS